MSLLQQHLTVPLIDAALQDLQVEVPHYFRPTLSINPSRLKNKFLIDTVNAVKHSLIHPDTSMRGDISRREVYSRINLAFEALRIMYFDEKLGLNQSLDILPRVLVDALRSGHKAGVMTDGRGCSANATRWIVDGSTQMDTADTTTDIVADLEADA